MSTMGALYRQARSLHEQRQAEAMQLKQPDARLLKEIEELNKIMTGLITAYKDAGGSKAA